jgi:peroxiredoxin
MGASAETNATAEERTARAPANELGRPVVKVGILLLVGSVSLNVVLARKVQSFHQLQSIKAAERVLKVGATVPPIIGKRLDGQQSVIFYQGTEQSTVLYIFTPPCSWCARNMDNLKTLLAREGGHYRFVGLSLSETTLGEYVAKNNLTFPVYSGLSPETLKAYKLGSTPQTIVISPDGKVLQDWVGAYAGDQKSQVEAFFRVKLPGIRNGP